MQAPTRPTTLSQKDVAFPLPRQLGLAAEFTLDLTLLLTAYFVALYLRRTLPFGRYVGAHYPWYQAKGYFLVAFALAATYALRLLWRRRPGGTPRPRPLRTGSTMTPRGYPHPTGASPTGASLLTAAPGLQSRGAMEQRLRFWTPVAGIVLGCIGLSVFVPTFSGLQKLYFAVGALILVALVVPWPLSGGHDTRPSLTWCLRRLWANRSLLRIWVQYNVQSRYAQAVLGILWIVLLPLSTALVMSMVFSHIMRVAIQNVPFIAFFLAGFVPWGLFNQSISAGMRALVSAMGLINQIYFPREIIVLCALGEALVDTFFMFAAMLVVDAVVGVFPNSLWAAIPVLLLIQLALCLGIMLVVSWLSLLVRDVPQLVSVLLQIGFYLSPVIYPLQIVPHQYRFIMTLNPLAVIIEAYHRIIVYARPPDWLSLLYPAALGVGLLVFGYRLFKTNEDRMADMV